MGRGYGTCAGGHPDEEPVGPVVSAAASVDPMRGGRRRNPPHRTADLGAVLKEGRVVAGEVMQALDGHSILIGIGRHRVPADSQVELQPGDRFLAKVEKTADGTVLKVLGEERGAGEPRLALALRQVLAEDRPVGRLLEDLAGKLRAAIDGGTDSREKLEALVKQATDRSAVYDVLTNRVPVQITVNGG